MGKVNVCLKRSYIVVISLIAIVSALLLAATLFSHGYLHEDEEIEKMLAGFHALYIICIVTLVLTIIGLYGACKEKKWALIVFVVGMILSSLFMIAGEIQGLASRPKEAEEMKKQYLNMLPLNNTSEALIDGFKDVQIELQCCGLDQGYLDWGDNIPESCLCTEESTAPCVAAPRDSSLSEHMTDDQPVMIYKEPCLPYLIEHEMAAINIALGVMLGILIFWILSVVLCILILCQLNQKEDIPVVVYSPEAKAGNYLVLADAAEYT
ncbi:tetraspanin-8-like [Epinephelus lanceolatus]|uniref:tetraspanin-8-like n=1 Tax=Epinephelus lanceolatus TaxID=310571 RepID=UPI0014466550|nr:tetraspanin-8-like [Epinephelus lanceolatus]